MAEPWRDELELIRGVDRDYPGLIRTDPHAFLDQAIHRLNRKHHTDRFGRKRKNDGTLNDDVVTYRMTERPQDKKLIDVIGGDTRFPMWDVRPAHEEPGNGTWAPVQTPDRDVIAPPPTPAPDPGITLLLAAILKRLDALEGSRRVSLKSHHCLYVCAEQSGEVNATRPHAGPWETFTLEPIK